MPQPETTRVQEQPAVTRPGEIAKPAAPPQPTPASSAGAVGAPAATPPPPAPVNRGDYVPPRPVKQVKPSTPSHVRNMITQDVRIDVRVDIDATGRVVRAEALTRGKQEMLTALALDAARQWRFSPAKQGSENVPSNAVVGFQFKKD